MKKLQGSIHRIVISGDVAVFRNGGKVSVYKLTPRRLAQLSKVPGYFEGSGLLGFSAYIPSNAAAKLGSIKSKKKAVAARKNGKKGGRPKKGS